MLGAYRGGTFVLGQIGQDVMMQGSSLVEDEEALALYG